MYVVVKQGGEVINEFHFEKGPIRIGRLHESEIYLPNRVVSRHHCVIYNTQEGKWYLEDLDSANKTFLNGQEIHKEEIKSADQIAITDYTIEIDLEEGAGGSAAENPEDTLEKTAYGLEEPSVEGTAGMHVIARKPYANHAPDVKLPIKRIKDFIRATERICKANGMDDLLKSLLKVAVRQFTAYHVWCSLRPAPSGEMAFDGGMLRDGQSITINEIKLHEQITNAVEEQNFLLIPSIPSKWEKNRIHSAMVAPILDQSGCFGVIYLDNAMDHEAYTLSDLDYLMLLCIHVATIVENF